MNKIYTKPSKKHQGFTLIELIIVIVLLGILAVTFAPRFIDISTDAKIAQLQALEGSIKTGANLIRNKAIVQGLHKRDGLIYLDVDNDNDNDVGIFSGYPSVGGQCSIFISGLPYWLDINLPETCTSADSIETISSDDWYGTITTSAFNFMPAGFTSISEGCYLRYTEPPFFGITATFSTTLVTTGC